LFQKKKKETKKKKVEKQKKNEEKQGLVGILRFKVGVPAHSRCNCHESRYT